LSSSSLAATHGFFYAPADGMTSSRSPDSSLLRLLNEGNSQSSYAVQSTSMPSPELGRWCAGMQGQSNHTAELLSGDRFPSPNQFIGESKQHEQLQESDMVCQGKSAQINPAAAAAANAHASAQHLGTVEADSGCARMLSITEAHCGDPTTSVCPAAHTTASLITNASADPDEALSDEPIQHYMPGS